MKKLVVFTLLLLLTQPIHAQLFSKERIINNENYDKKFLTWGYFLGFNSYDYNFDYIEDKKDILINPNVGFNVGMVSDMRINSFLNLRLEPGLFITRRVLNFDESLFNGLDFKDSYLIREVNSTYIHIPLLLKVSTKRINNFKPYIVGGFSTSLNLSTNEKIPFDNSDGEFRTKKFVYFYELGFGIDFYTYFFKFTPSIRGIFAINDELIRDADPNSPWTGNVSKMQTRGIFMNFTFE